MSVYTPNIPQAGDVPAQSQSLMLANFQALQNDLDKNHVAISDLVNRGKHNFCQFPRQLADPATAATDGALYTKISGLGTVELYYRKENNGSVIPLTNGFIPNILAVGFTSGAAYQQVIQVPDNTYGNIFFFDPNSTLSQIGWYYCVGNIARSMATRLDYEPTDPGTQHVLSLRNDPPADNFIYCKRNLPASNITYAVRVIYWNI